MRIDVTQADIENGESDSPCHCPIALALKRQTGKQWYVDKDYCSLSYRRNDVLLPFLAAEFIDQFDNGYPVTPISFDLDLEGVAK